MHKQRLAAYAQMNHAAREPHDKRVGSKHDRRSRGFVSQMIGGMYIKFYPLKHWPATVGVTSMTLRNWLVQNIITAYTMHRMHVMCEAEMAALRDVVQRWYSSRDLHNAIEPAFRQEMREALAEVRLALDTAKLNRTLTERQQHLLRFYTEV
jgi:hypothetical protein